MKLPQGFQQPEPGQMSPRRLAASIRLAAAKMIRPHGFGYLGQALSSAEQVAATVTQLDWERDRFICSPGHYIIAIYAAAHSLDILSDEQLEHYGENGAELEAIGTETTPLVDYTCGSLAQGLSAAAGFALADRMRAGEDAGHVYALISDGELEEGQTWEAALFAAHQGLDRVIALLDANDSQVDGPVSAVTTIEPIADKWRSFGWHVLEVDGHDIDAVVGRLTEAKAETGKPTVIISRTSTVHGIDALPEDADGHFIKFPPPLAEKAVAELEQALEMAK